MRDEIFDNPLLEVGVFREFSGGVSPESLHIMSKGLHAHDKILYMVLHLVFSRDKFDCWRSWNLSHSDDVIR